MIFYMSEDTLDRTLAELIASVNMGCYALRVQIIQYPIINSMFYEIDRVALPCVKMQSTTFVSKPLGVYQHIAISN